MARILRISTKWTTDLDRFGQSTYDKSGSSSCFTPFTGGSMRPIILGALMPLLCLSVVRGAQGQYRANPLPAGSDTVSAHVQALTLQDLITRADRIFLGYVESVEKDPKQVAGKRVVKITITVKEPKYFLKGKFEPKFTIYQTERSSVVNGGETVFWFLGKPNHEGLSGPIGHSSGDFRIVDGDPYAHSALVENADFNSGLWGEGELWRIAPEDEVRAKLASIAASVSEHKRDEWMKKGRGANPREPLPLDLLMAIVRVNLTYSAP